MGPDVFPSPKQATIPVLCFYRVWSAFESLGFADGAKMIHVKDVKDIARELRLQMTHEMKRGHKFLGVKYPSRWIHLYSLLRDGRVIPNTPDVDPREDQLSS